MVFAPDHGLTRSEDARPGFEALVDLAASSPAGSGGTVFTPWLAGERSPVDDKWARAGFHNLSLGTNQADLVRSVLEGVAFIARWLHDAVERFVKRRLDPIRVFGGGAQSDLWCQIHADVMDRTVERLTDPMHTGLRGAAMLAGLALGDIDRASAQDLVEVDRTFPPQPATREVYDRLYEEFPKLYRAQKGMFRRLNRPRRTPG
jgi:xylulokinase